MFNYYETANIIGSKVVPGAVDVLKNATAAYFAKYLLEKAIAVYKWTLPKTWDKDYFLYSLYVNGFVGVFNSGAKYGVIPQWGTLNEYNLYYAPSKFMCSNPLLKKTVELTIHEQCELIKLQGNYTGIWDMICYYAGKMALLAEAVDMNAINVKSSKIFFTKNKAAAETLKKLFDKVSSGNPCVVLDTDLLNDEGKLSWEWFNDNLGQNYIVDDLLIDLRKLENEFCTDLGIPNSNTEKRERMITDEVNSNNTETALRAELWLERLQDCVERVNTMFETNIKVEWRHDPNDRNLVDTGNTGNTPGLAGQSTSPRRA